MKINLSNLPAPELAGLKGGSSCAPPQKFSFLSSGTAHRSPTMHPVRNLSNIETAYYFWL